MKFSLHWISLGCAKNLVDSERLLGSAVGNLSFRVTADPAEADLIVVNTCAFLESAVEEALAALMEAGRRKKPGAFLVVAGCLPARYRGREGAEMAQGLPEVDLWLPPADYPDFERKIAALFSRRRTGRIRPGFTPGGLPAGRRRPATPFFRAYLKIAEGCDHRCAYCLIPTLRGPLQSAPSDRLVEEAEELADGGVRELTLVAQDLTASGRDQGRPEALLALARQLAEIPGLAWLRLLYAYPEGLTETLVRGLAETPKVLPYLDLPLQHAAPDILRRMGRRPAPPLKLVERLRRWWPGLTLRTTLIVGFPGESETHFAELLKFVAEAAFDHLGVFKYSPEAGTRAAGFADQVPAGIKEKRRRAVSSAQKGVALARNRSRLGQVVEVLVEGPADEGGLVQAGRAYFQAPEVDGLIYFDGEQPATGRLVPTRLVKASAYDLAGRLV
ncbi:MAG: 30S ribosomal protein S12 methylthiotransferase RimO [Candidatus Adiutrix sp.]|jgi:ribosomal protein S12 methylthiotransferase RimO|nr:30S ribosomal protein S12 methylthiotransferase RimO [Candidatus Adiutrix sp.]